MSGESQPVANLKVATEIERCAVLVGYYWEWASLPAFLSWLEYYVRMKLNKILLLFALRVVLWKIYRKGVVGS